MKAKIHLSLGYSSELVTSLMQAAGMFSERKVIGEVNTYIVDADIGEQTPRQTAERMAQRFVTASQPDCFFGFVICVIGEDGNTYTNVHYPPRCNNNINSVSDGHKSHLLVDIIRPIIGPHFEIEEGETRTIKSITSKNK